jgi:hypothetical protein
MSGRRTNFFIVFEGRCGSGLLLSMLNHSPHVHVENEWMMFKLKKDENGGLHQANRVAHFFDKEHYRSLESLGFINKLSDILEPPLFAEQLRIYVDRIVSLRRNNVLKPERVRNQHQAS